MMSATCFFGTMNYCGTGFLIEHADPRFPGAKGLMMVTTAHILEQAGKEPLFVAVRMSKGKEFQPIALLRLETEQSGRLRYTRHPKQDVAAFMVEVPKEVAGSIAQFAPAPQAAIANPDPVVAGREVGFLGFPEVFPGTPGGYPILRSGKIASNVTGELRREETFVVNADVYAGDSGAPVFGLDSQGKLRLEGLVTDRVGATPEAFSHFAVAADASAIRETIGLLDRQLRSNPRPEKSTPREQPREPLLEQPSLDPNGIAQENRSRWLYPFSFETRIKSLQTASARGTRGLAPVSKMEAR